MKCWAVVRNKDSAIVAVFPHNRKKQAEDYLFKKSEVVKLDGVDSLFPFLGVVVEYELSHAMKLFRTRMLIRSHYKCTKCGHTVTWTTAELHEKKSRGKGGYRTEENCEILCREHHTGQQGEHVRAKWQGMRVIQEIGEEDVPF